MRGTKRQKVERSNVKEVTSDSHSDGYKMGGTENGNLPIAEVDETFRGKTILMKTDRRNMVLRSCSQSVVTDCLNIASREGGEESAQQVTVMEQISRPIDTFPEHSGKVIDILSLSNPKESGDAIRSAHAKGTLETQDHALKQGVVGPISVKPLGNTEGDVVKQAEGNDYLEEIKRDAMEKLRQFINEKGGQLGDGWEVKILKKRGRVETNFLAPEKQKMKSQVDVARYLGLLSKSGETKIKCATHQQGGFGMGQNDHISRNKKDTEFFMTVGSDSHKRTTEFYEGCNSHPQLDISRANHFQGKQGENPEQVKFNLSSPGREVELPPSRCHDMETKVLKVGRMDTKGSDMLMAVARLGADQNKEGCQPTSALIGQQCQDVLRRIISADKFASLCSMFQNVPSGSWEKGFTYKPPTLTLGGFDFQLISLRMAAGAYGETPEMFIADLQQVWKNIHLVGNELILLADSLSRLSYRLYNEQVLTLLPEVEGREKSDGIGPLQENLSGEQTSPIHTHEPGQQPIDMSGHSSEEGVALKESGVDDPSIRGDGEKDHFSDAGDAEKQSKSQVVSSLHALEVVESSLQPSLAVKNMRKSGAHLQRKGQQKRTSVPKSKQTLKTASDESVCKVCGLRDDDSLIVCSLCKVRYHISCLEPPLPNIPENVWCCHICALSATDNYPGIKRSDQTGEIVSCDAQELPLVVEQKDKHAEHTSVKEIQEPSEANLKDGLCKICAKDDQQVRLCDSCDSAYHIHCLIPGLDEAADGNWLCPMCNADGKKQVDLVSLHDIGYPVDAKHTLESSQPCAGSEQNGERAVVPVESNVVEYPAIVAMDRICKVCGAGEDERVIICCDACAVYYHVSCLKPPLKKIPSATWYCPSCLCRVCKVDIDDDKILLCDACNEGYHTYCLSPPLQNIPDGCWYCPSCAVNEVLAGKTLVTRDSPIVASTMNSKMPTEELDRRELSKRKRKRADPKRATR